MIRGLEHLSCEERLRVQVVEPGEEQAPGTPSCGFQYLKGAYRKDGDRLFSRACCDRTRGNGFKLKDGRFRLDISICYNKGGKTLAQIAQRGGQFPISEDIEGQVGWGSEQPGLVEDVPAHFKGLD